MHPAWADKGRLSESISLRSPHFARLCVVAAVPRSWPFLLKIRCTSLDGHENVRPGLLVAGTAQTGRYGSGGRQASRTGLCGGSVDDQVEDKDRGRRRNCCCLVGRVLLEPRQRCG